MEIMESTTDVAFGAKEFDDTATSYEEGNGGCTTAVASYLAEICGPITKDSYVLDCAAGPGIVVDALLSANGPDAKKARYAIVEPAPGMMDIVKHKIATQWEIPEKNVATFVKPAEEMDSLGISPGQLSHAFSTFGIMFFSDADAAVGHIFELLKPNGTAFVTTFAHIGYVPPVAKVCNQIRPGEEPFKLLMSDSWYEASHLEQMMRKAGFTQVEMQTMECPMTRPSLKIVADSIAETFNTMWKEKGWTEREFEAFTNALEKVLSEDRENVLIDGAGVHIKMTANIAICKK